jgi:hypothetical protein
MMGTSHEHRVRRLARRNDHYITKSRDRTLHSDNYGEYMLVNYYNTVVLGDRYNTTLEQIEDYFAGPVS